MPDSSAAFHHRSDGVHARRLIKENRMDQQAELAEMTQTAEASNTRNPSLESYLWFGIRAVVEKSCRGAELSAQLPRSLASAGSPPPQTSLREESRVPPRPHPPAAASSLAPSSSASSPRPGPGSGMCHRSVPCARPRALPPDSRPAASPPERTRHLQDVNRRAPLPTGGGKNATRE